MEELREKMHQAIEKYGLSSKEALKASEDLDKLVAKEQYKRFLEVKVCTM